MEGGKKGKIGKVKEGEKEKTADQESKWGSTDIPPTQTHPVLIFVIFLALWSTVVGRTVSPLMVCMTGCHGLRGGFPLPQRMPLPSLCGDPHLFSPNPFFLTFQNSCHFFSVSPLQFNWKNKSTRAQLCCLLHLLPSWHPLFSISYEACVWQHAYLYTCKLAGTFMQACTCVSGCKCEHTSEHKHIFLHILRSAKKSEKTVKGHRSGQV